MADTTEPKVVHVEILPYEYFDLAVESVAPVTFDGPRYHPQFGYEQHEWHRAQKGWVRVTGTITTGHAVGALWGGVPVGKAKPLDGEKRVQEMPREDFLRGEYRRASCG